MPISAPRLSIDHLRRHFEIAGNLDDEHLAEISAQIESDDIALLERGDCFHFDEIIAEPSV